MPVTPNMAVAFDGTVASIPAGWQRVTSLDARYILGAATGQDADLITNRGSLTHTHTSPAHAPLQQPHTHFFDNSGTTTSSVLSSSTTGAFSHVAAAHDHDVAESDPTTAVNNSVSITVDTTSNDLSYYTVIWIKPSSNQETLPINSIGFYDKDILPSGWALTATNKYLKGAAGAANGGTSGGSNTHTHTSPAHVHTQVAHSHTGISGPPIFSVRVGSGTTQLSRNNHVHSVTLNADYGVNQAVTTTITASNHEPPYMTLHAIKASAESLPDGIICLWLDKEATIPSDWSRVAAMNGKFLKTSSTLLTANLTGGSSSHTHTASDCQPIQDDHIHASVTSGAGNTSIGGASTGATSKATTSHTHTTGWNVDINAPINDPASVTIDSCTSGAAYPQHRTVIFIKYTAPTVKVSGYLSYTYNEWDSGVGLESTPRDPAIQQKIWSRDWRYR